jgi:ABC-type amino acid transport substrate-binding protein
MKRFFPLLFLAIFLSLIPLSFAQEAPVPTLVPPTPVPVEPTAQSDSLPSESRIARIQRDGKIRVGILYNELPFGQFNIRGELTGFDADLARLMAETWEVELEFVQVTRQNQFEKLDSGEVDMLMAAVVHTRELDERYEFSQSYRLGHQSIMVLADSSMETLANASGQTVGFVIGTEGQDAIVAWSAQFGLAVNARAYLTYDQMLAALFGGEVVAIVGRDTHLLRSSLANPDAVKLVETPLQDEPFAVAMPRQDRHLRNLVNRTLQYLAADAPLGQQSTLQKLYVQYFPDTLSFDVLTIYSNLGEEAPKPSQFPTDISFPSFYAAPDILSNGVLRVAGLTDPNNLPPEQVAVAQANRAVAEQLAARWGVRVEYVQGDALSLVASGQAHLAMGINPDWNAGEVDFSQAYILHGRRILYPSNKDYERFGGLLPTSRIVATVQGDEGAWELAEAWAATVNIFNLRPFEARQESIASTILEDNNALVVFGDSFYLLPALRENPDTLAIGPEWYDRRYLVMALPQNDIDFMRLVNYTLQEMVRDGSLNALVAPVMPSGEDAPHIGIWPGSTEYLGLQLRR